MSGFPDTQGFAYSFHRAELSADRYIYALITNVEIDQPTVEGAVYGTRSHPLLRTVGKMELGAGVVTFSDEGERSRFIERLGDAYREKTWSLAWKLTAPNKPMINIEAFGCRVLGNPFAHQEGEEGLGGDILFSFMHHKVNGRSPHSGLPST